MREGLELPQLMNGTMNPFHFYRFGSTTPAAITFTSAATACRVASLRATRGPSPPALPTTPLALPVTLLRAADTQCAAARALCERLTQVKCSTLVGRAAPLRTRRSGAHGLLCLGAGVAALGTRGCVCQSQNIEKGFTACSLGGGLSLRGRCCPPPRTTAARRRGGPSQPRCAPRASAAQRLFRKSSNATPCFCLIRCLPCISQPLIPRSLVGSSL